MGDVGYVFAIAMAVALAFTNGFHDAANAIATQVATRAARPLPAVLMAAFFNMLGPLVFGDAVANTVGKIVEVAPADVVPVIGAGLTGAVVWNVFTWRLGLPSSSSHALTGGLVGAALVTAGGHAVNWGGLEGWRPVGVFGILIALAISPILGVLAARGLEMSIRWLLRRGTVRFERPILRAQWVTSSWLAFSHGSNDAQKAVGIVAVVLLAHGTTTDLSAPLWVKATCAGALTAGTALGPMVCTILQPVHAQEGDFRTWTAIREWGSAIADALRTEHAPVP